MSAFGSQQALNMARSSSSIKGDPGFYARSDLAHGGGNGYDNFMDGYKSSSYTFTRTGTMGGAAGNVSGGGGGASLSINQRAAFLQSQCNEYLKKAEFALQSGGSPGDAEHFLSLAKESIDRLKGCALDMRQMGQPNDSLVRSVEMYRDQLKGVHMALSSSNSLGRRRSQRGSSGAGWDDPGRSFQDAMGWMSQQKRLIETAPWGDDPAAIEQQLISHQKFHSSIQRSVEVDRAREELSKKGDKGNLYALDREWDTLQQMSHGRTQQLRELLQIIEAISKEIMWVNDREEEELVFDWGDKNVEQYIPRKQEAYSKLMSALEDKERDLNKLKNKVDTLLKNKHPAADKIEAYKDTLQTQWSWLLQITKCIDTHLKENGAYSQFFKEANETYKALQKEHESVRKKFACDKKTPLENLLELLKNLEREKEKIMEHKRHVQHLVSKSRSIVRLKPRNPEEKSSNGVIVKALCDFKQDQKVICQNNEAILKDNGQRSKWLVTGPGGLDMLVPSVCLIVPPPNPLSISLANKNEQYYEAILSIWNQLLINVKSLIAWQYCTQDIQYINSLTLSVLSRMRPEEYRQIFKNMETHYDDFILNSHGSQMFADEDKRDMENQFNSAQAHYDQLLVQLPSYVIQQDKVEVQQAAEQQEQQQQQQLIILQQQQQEQQRIILLQQQQEQQQLILLQQEQEEEEEEEERRSLQEERRLLEEEKRRLEEERRRVELRKQAARKEAASREHVIKKEVVKMTKAEPAKKKVQASTSSSAPSSHSLSELHALRLRLEAIEGMLSQHVHICIGEDGVRDCGLRISQLEVVQRDLNSLREQFLRLRDRVLRELQGMGDTDKAQFLRDELGVIDERLGSIESLSGAHVQRLRSLREMLDSVSRAEDIIKVHEARLTEKETTSLSTQEVEDYSSALKSIKAELEQKKSILASMETELANASQWDAQVGGPFHRCDLMLSKYKEDVGLLSDRWRRILGQIDTRLQDLQLYLPQLQHYQLTSSDLSGWIDATRRKQDALLTMQVDNVQALKEHMDKQKALNAEIKAKRATVDGVLKDNDACVLAIRDYESDLASYTSGLETLLNIPIKRTMLRSPAMDLNHEAVQLQTRYMELLTQSADYYKFLGALLKNMEELKIRNTRIDLLEEELRLLKEGMQDHNNKNKSMEEALARYKLELSQSQNELLSMQEVKQSSALQYSSTKRDLDDMQGQLGGLRDEVGNLKFLLEEEKRKRKLAEERYAQLSDEHDLVLRKKQSELETISWSKVEVEKSIAGKDQELELLRRQLEDEAAKVKELQKEIAKVRTQCNVEMNNLKLSYESQISVSHADVQRLAAQREDDGAHLKLQYDRMESEMRGLEEELLKLRMSLSQAEELRRRAEAEAQNQRSLTLEEGRRRREVESQVEALMLKRNQDSSHFREELEELMKVLEEKKDQLGYVEHKLDEETRWRKTMEEGQGVLEQTVAQLQARIAKLTTVATQLKEREEELQTTQLELERERRERGRVEQNASTLQARIKDVQLVRDRLESQVNDLRRDNQDQVSRRRQAEAELEKSTLSATEHSRIIATLREQQERASASENRGEEERLRLQRELEQSLSRYKTSEDTVTRLSSELKALQRQLLQEQLQVKDLLMRNQDLSLALEEKIQALNLNSAELHRLKEVSETLSKDKLRLEKEVASVRDEKEQLLQAKKGSDEELSSQIAALQLQLKASERHNTDHQNLVTELSSEREKLKEETEKIQKEASEMKAAMQSLQSKYNSIVSEKDALLLEFQTAEKNQGQNKQLEEELMRIKLSSESDLRDKQRLQQENERMKMDVKYWKDQCDSKQIIIKQSDADKEGLERDKQSLKSEIERLMRELRALEESFKSKLVSLQNEMQEVAIAKQAMETQLKKPREPPAPDASALIFDGVRKSVNANQLLDCGVLDKQTFDLLVKGQRTVPELSADRRVHLKGTGPIAGVVIENPDSSGALTTPFYKLTLSEAKNENLIPPECADLLLDAQAATGHIIDARTNQKFTVDEACNQAIVDNKDKKRLLAAEAAAVGYTGQGRTGPLSVFQAMKNGMIDQEQVLRLLQAQESVGGILDPVLSVLLPKDTAIERNLIDNSLCRALNQKPKLYLDPETEEGVTYDSIKKRCKVDPSTGLLLLPVSERIDPSKLVFEGVRKPVTAKQLLECQVLEKTVFRELEKGKKSVPEVSEKKKTPLKGTGPIAGVIAGSQGKLSLSEAKKQMLLPEDVADLLLEAQAATGHIIDPQTNQKMTVDEACIKEVVDLKDRDKLLAAEAAAVGYKDPSAAKPISVFEAMNKGMVDKETGLRLLQAQESVGGILDPNLSVFLPKDTAIKRKLIDENLHRALNQDPQCYLDPDTERDISYGMLKKRCMTEPHTGLLLLPISERVDPSKLIFDGVRKPVTAKQLLDCRILDDGTFTKLVKGEKTIEEVSEAIKIPLKGTGSIAGVTVGPSGKMSLSEAKKQMLMSTESADYLLESQAATGHIIDPMSNQKLTVQEALARRVVDIADRDKLLAAEAAAVGFQDFNSGQALSVYQAMKRGMVDKKLALRLLQAQESAGGILDPNFSVFLPQDEAIKRNLLDNDLSRALNQNPSCYLDPDTNDEVSYQTLKKKCKLEYRTGLSLLPIVERKDPNKLMFDGVRKQVSAQQLFDCGILNKRTFDKLLRGETMVPDVAEEKMVYLKGTGPIAGIVAGEHGKMSFSEAKKQMIVQNDTADLLLEAQAATGHIIDPKTDQKLTVDEACARGIVDIKDKQQLLTAEAAAVGFKDPKSNKLLSVFEAMKRGLVDEKTTLRLLQAQESVGGILDPNLSVFLPKDIALKRNLIDEGLHQILSRGPPCYLDPDVERVVSYGTLKKRCKTDPNTDLQILPVTEKMDASSILFDGVRRSVNAQELLDCGVIDKTLFTQLIKGEKSVKDVSVDKRIFLKGTGAIAGVSVGPSMKMSFTEAKNQKLMSPESADLLLFAQAATGHIIDPRTNQKLNVKEACAKGVVNKEDESKLFAAEAAAIGYRDSNSSKLLSAGQAYKSGLIDKDTALCLLQAQEAAGGILDPVLSVFLPKDSAKSRGLIDHELYQALNQRPECYIDPDTQQSTTYVSLKKTCKPDPSTGLLLLPEPRKPITLQGLRGKVSVIDLSEANLLKKSDMDQLNQGRLTSKDIEDHLRPYLGGSTCIAGVYDETSKKALSIYQALKDGLLQPGTALELLEAQAASGFIVDPVNNLYLTVDDAYSRGLLGAECKDSLLAAERAVTGYKVPGSNKLISLFQAIQKGLVEKRQGIKLLQAQLASGGIIDPERSHRVDTSVAYRRGFLDTKMNEILNTPSAETRNYFDPNTEEKLTYSELKKRCRTDKKTGLLLLPLMDQKSLESIRQNTTRRRRVVIVDPDTNKEMTVREAFNKGYIDRETYIELSQQECEWEEITITDPDGTVHFQIIDKGSGRQYNISELLEKGVIDQKTLEEYRSHTLTLTQFADMITEKTKGTPQTSSSSFSSMKSSTSSGPSAAMGTTTITSTSRSSTSSQRHSGTSSTSKTLDSTDPSFISSSVSSVPTRSLSPSLSKTITKTTTIREESTSFSSGSSSHDSPDSVKHFSSISVNLGSPFEAIPEQEPVGAIFDSDTLEKITITEAMNRELVDVITAQRLLEAQACTGGIVDPANGRRIGIQEASRMGLIDEDMASKLKPAQKAFFGYEDMKTKRKMSAAQAMKEMWLPYEAGQRFLEYQTVTGGLYDPENNCRRSIEEALKMGWLDVRAAQRLHDVKNHSKNLTCPKSKLKISYKEALDNCLSEENTGVRMLHASSISSKGISSPYNVGSAPGSQTGSRSGSRRGSRRGSLDMGAPTQTVSTRYSSFSTSTVTK